MSGPPTSRTWATISREMVGSTASPMWRTNPWRSTECLREVLVKNALSSSPSFSPPSQIRTTLSCIGNVALVHSSSLVFVFCFFISILFGFFPIHFRIFTPLHFFALGCSIITCRSIQRHILAFESDINVFRSILFPFRELERDHMSHHAVPQRGSVCAPPPKKMPKRNFDLMCA